MFLLILPYLGATVYLPIYFESSLGLDATAAGSGLIALLGGTVIGANLTGRFMPHVKHYKRMGYAGYVAAILALGGLALFAPTLNFALADALTLLLGVGLGPLFPTLTVAVQNAVDPRDLGIATATLAFTRTLGSAIGVAVFGAIIVAFGVVASGTAPGAGVDVARSNLAFQAAFAIMSLSMVASLGCFALMRELPLRGPAREPAPVET